MKLLALQKHVASREAALGYSNGIPRPSETPFPLNQASSGGLGIGKGKGPLAMTQASYPSMSSTPSAPTTPHHQQYPSQTLLQAMSSTTSASDETHKRKLEESKTPTGRDSKRSRKA